MCLTALASCCCCSSIFFMTAVFILYLLTSRGDYETTCYRNDAVTAALPLAPKHYPKELQGIIWMDQSGFYSHSDLPYGVPDLALSFGDTDFSEYDPESRTVEVSVWGPAWSWMNRWDGRLFFSVFQWWLPYHYIFELNDDVSVIQVYPTIRLGPLGSVSMPKWLLSFTMEKLPTKEGDCPPKAGASKKDIAKCATWDRKSTSLISPLLGRFGVIHYYVWQIVDGEGKPVQPYYDVYQDFANRKPSDLLSKLTGLTAGTFTDPMCQEAGTAFRGVRATGPAAALANVEL
mmetsp:Transcript_92201/g.192786  ORF Transcript_92201/g.192786 Transcript_92201/m.192786 type:complete len:289 (-) Transcript_92201:424-1290(-)